MNNDSTEKRLTPDSVKAVQPDTNDSQNKNQDSSADNSNESQNNDSNNNDNRNVSGYAIVFGQESNPIPTEDGGKFTEVISSKALDGVDLSNVVMLNEHDPSQVLASVKSGTLKLNVDSKGLHFEATLPDTTVGNDVLKNIQSGLTDSTSFSFAVADDGDQFTTDDDGNITRTINQVKSLFDVSVVAVPAYDGGNSVKVDSRSYEKFIQSINKKKEIEKRSNLNMEKEKTIINPTKSKEDREESAFEEYVRSCGAKRDLTGLTTDAGRVVIPSEIVTPILELKNQKYNLGALISRKQVSNPSGTYPVALNSGATLKTKKELAEVPDADADFLKGIDYKLQTYAGKVYVSEEEIEDSVVNIKAEIQKQLQDLVQNTENAGICAVLTTAGNFQTASASLSNLDDIKKIKNTMLDPALNLTVVVGQNLYNQLDTMKDSEGRYLLQPDVTAASGKSLLGMPVSEVSETLLPQAKGLVIMDGQQSVFEAYKPQITANWQEFNYFAEGLAVALRADFKPVDKNSAVVVSVGGASGAGKNN